MRKVGILGGMGPEATVLLMKKIIECTKAQDDQDHIPLLVDNNTQVPSRIEAIINKNGSDPLPELCKMASSLEKNGASALAMPCNTAHLYIKEIRKQIKIPFISIVEESAAYLKKVQFGAKKIGILASPAVKITKIFEYELEKNNMNLIYIGDENLILSTIKQIKSNFVSGSVSEKLEEISIQAKSIQLDLILIACSEFSIVSDEIKRKFNIPVVDTLEILASRIVNFSKKN